jgi:phosphate transport system protein
MRTAFHEQLSALCAQIGEMCGLAADAMERATHALLEADLSVAEQVIADQAHIVAMSRHAEDSAVKLLALQQPVASDLRSIVGSMHIGADIERMGALSAHVASIARLRHPECAVPDEVRGCFTEMGTVAVKLARTAQEVLLTRDPDRAAALRDEDDAVDAQHRHLFTVLIDRKWHDGVSAAVDVALLGRYYERFADHAVEIGRRVVFEATGGLPMQKQLG